MLLEVFDVEIIDLDLFRCGVCGFGEIRDLAMFRCGDLSFWKSLIGDVWFWLDLCFRDEVAMRMFENLSFQMPMNGLQLF